MKKINFINRVLLIMNEAGTADVKTIFTSGADSTQVDRYIEGSFSDAWRTCASVMPRSWFTNKDFSFYPILPDHKDGTGMVILPKDLYLLSSFKMTGWKKAVYELYNQNDRVSSIQQNKITRGSSIRPVVVSENNLFKVENNIIVIGEDPIPQMYPFDNGVVYCSLNNKTYEWIDDPRPYKGIWDATIKYNNFDTVYFNGNLMYANGDNTNVGNYTTNWVNFVLVIQSEKLVLKTIYKDVYTSKLYAATSVSTIQLLNIDEGIVNTLTYYSLPENLTSHNIEKAIYVPIPKDLGEYNDDDEIDIDQRVLEPLAYISAATVFTLFEKYEIVKALEARVERMIPGLRSIKGDSITYKQ